MEFFKTTKTIDFMRYRRVAMVASTVNSYSRLVPGFWAPTSATWGVENRTCALRVIQGGAKSQRVESDWARKAANGIITNSAIR